MIKIKKDNILYPLEWRRDILDFLYKEIIEDEIYNEFFNFNDNDVIVDLGANIGLYSLYAINKMPSISKIYMVEPLMKNFDYMIRNIIYNRNDIHKFIFIKAGISKTGFLNFLKENYSHSPDINESDIGIGDDNELYEKIKMFSFMDFIEFYNIDKIDILKLDIEGSEVQMFDEETFEYFKNNDVKICSEFHPTKRRYAKELLNIIKRFIDMGYEIKITSTDGFDIKNNIINNVYLSNEKMYSWDYYNQYLFYAKRS